MVEGQRTSPGDTAKVTPWRADDDRGRGVRERGSTSIKHSITGLRTKPCGTCTGHLYPMHRPPLPNAQATPTQSNPLAARTWLKVSTVPKNHILKLQKCSTKGGEVMWCKETYTKKRRAMHTPQYKPVAPTPTLSSHTHPQLPSRGPVIRHSGWQGAGRWSGVGLLTLQLGRVVVDTLYGAKLQAREAAGGGG